MSETISDSGRRLKHNSLSDVAFEALRRQIISLELEPGQRLNLDKLAADFGISPTPLREALNRLAAQRMIKIEAYRGFVVEPLLTVDEISSLCSIRYLLESHALKEALPKMADADVTELADIVREMDELIARKPFNALEFNVLDQMLHRKIVAKAGNPFLEDAYAALNVHVQIARLFQLRAIQHSSPANDEHRELIAAIAARDHKSAHHALKNHIASSRARLVNLVRQRNRDGTADAKARN